MGSCNFGGSDAREKKFSLEKPINERRQMIWGKRILPFGVITIALAALFLAGRVSPRALARS
jgi:hypothetical protein